MNYVISNSRDRKVSPRGGVHFVFIRIKNECKVFKYAQTTKTTGNSGTGYQQRSTERKMKIPSQKDTTIPTAVFIVTASDYERQATSKMFTSFIIMLDTLLILLFFIQGSIFYCPYLIILTLFWIYNIGVLRLLY